MKSTLILLASLLGSNFLGGSCSGTRTLGQQQEDIPVEKSSPLEEIVTADGAIVRFFEAEAGSGMLAVVSSVPKGIIDPIHSYFEKAGIEGTKTKNMEDFYVQLTGDKPSDLLIEAFRQQQANQESESERKGWNVDESEVVAAPDESGESDGTSNRELCLNCDSPVGSKQWWIDTACRSVTEYDWCRCLTFRTGNGYKIKTSDDYFQSAYVYRGQIYSKLEFWKCGWTCEWKYLIADVIDEGWRTTIWGQGGGSWTYKGSISNGEGDGFHVSRYDAEDSDIGCQIGGLGGCYVCPSID